MTTKAAVTLLDANAWIKEQLLRSAVGAALLHAIGQLGVKIVLPAFTRTEVVNGITRIGRKAVSDANNALSIVQAIVGQRPGFKSPQPSDFATACDQRFLALDHHLLPLQHSSVQMERALARVITGKSPSSRKEQFRDSLLWEIALDLAVSQDVFLVSRDGDFSGGKNAGLASDLDDELRAVGKTVRFFPEIADLVSFIQPQVPPLDRTSVAKAITAGLDQCLRDIEERQAINIGGLSWKRLDPFITEQPDTLAIKFRLNFPATFAAGLGSDGEAKGKVIVTGECFYNTRTSEASLVRPDYIYVHDPSGNTQSHIFVSAASDTSERQPVPYTLRRPLP